MMRFSKLLVLVVLMISATTFAKGDDPVVTSKGIEVTVEKFKAGMGGMNFFLYVVVKNTSDSTVFFDSGDLEIVNKEGMTFFSVSKNKESVSAPLSMGNLITALELKPGRATKGMIYFPTSMGEAKRKGSQLFYGESNVVLKN